MKPRKMNLTEYQLKGVVPERERKMQLLTIKK